MPVFKNALFVSFMLIFTCGLCMAAPKLGFLDKIFRHSDDVIKLGKKTGKLAPNIRVELIKKYPRLANASEDLLSGIHSIENITANSASAGKMIDNEINPAKVAILAARSPKTIEAGDKIAEIFAAAKVPQQAISKMPAPAVSALRKVDGNYREAGEMFIKMEHRGGAKAVDVAEKLSQYATLRNAAAVSALGLLAWHMADPAGAEQAVEEFFKEHMAPMAAAPVKGVLNAAGDTVQKSLETAANRTEEIAMRYWPALLVILFLILLWRVPNLRRMPFVILDNFFGRINKRMEMAPPASQDFKQKDSSERRSKEEKQSKINVFKK